jgi:hypothetical protein
MTATFGGRDESDACDRAARLLLAKYAEIPNPAVNHA